MDLKININTYKIIIVDENDNNLKMEDGCYHFGVCDMKNKIIYLMRNLPKDSLFYTIKHELTHAYIDSYGFLQVDYTDEIIADFIASYIINIEKDYQKILKYYKQEDKKWKNNKTMKE